MTEEAHRLIKTIRQMRASISDEKPNPNYDVDDGLEVTYPLTRCLKDLKEQYSSISKLHKERFEQVRSMDPDALCCGTPTDIPQNSQKPSNRTHHT